MCGTYTLNMNLTLAGIRAECKPSHACLISFSLLMKIVCLWHLSSTFLDTLHVELHNNSKTCQHSYRMPFAVFDPSGFSTH